MKTKFISIPKFKKIKEGDPLTINFMSGIAEAASTPSLTGIKDERGNIVNEYVIKVKFNSGPWEGETLRLIRQQINKI